MPRATLSRRISQLEASLGVKLLHRSTRRLSPTAAGLELYQRSRHILHQASEARDAVRRLDGIPRGMLRIATLPTMGTKLQPLVSEYLKRYPQTQIELVSSAKVTNLVEHGFDLAIRAGGLNDSSLVVHRISQTEVFPVAAPSYLSHRGTPQNAAELSAHECLIGYQSGEIPNWVWPLRQGGEARISGRLISNDLSLLLAAALDGQGIALLPMAITQEGLENGELKAVLQELIGSQTQLSLVHTSKEFLEPKVRAFTDLAVPYLKEQLFLNRSLKANNP